MSAESNTGTGPEDLQFDRAISPDDAASTGTPVCAKCNAAIRMYYYDVNGETICSSCKQAVERANGGGAGKSGGGMMKAMLFGLGAAIAGAIIYYSVMEYLDLEIGYVAILIGFMVGYAIRSAALGRGGRRFQILAAGLTYFAVALAYAPFAFRGMDAASQMEEVADSARGPIGQAPAASDAAAEKAPDDGATSNAAVDGELDEAGAAAVRENLGLSGYALAFGAGILFIVALPVVAILGSMPSGLISALIIGLGMHTAWSMTRATQLSITGPFKVGTERASAAA